MTGTHPEKRPIGYARVSTYGQTLDVQLEQLRKAGCSSRNIYRENVTGARADRRELNRMLGKLAPGDVVTVTRIDRLARSTFDLFGIVKLAGSLRRLPTRPKQLGASKARQPASPRPRTRSSNPVPSSGESTNCRYLVASASRLRDAPRGQWQRL